MGCGCVSAGLHACTTAPITERRQLKLIPESKLNAQAAELYEKVKQKAKLSDDKESLDKIIQIGSKIENSICIDRSQNIKFTLLLLAHPTKNT